MKKSLSFLLVLVMVAVLAVPAVVTAAPVGDITITSVEATIGGSSYPVIMDKATNKILIPKTEDSAVDFSAVNLAISLADDNGAVTSANGAYVKLGDTEVTASTTLNLTSAVTLKTYNEDTESKTYTVEVYEDTKPADEEVIYGDADGDPLDFEDLSIDIDSTVTVNGGFTATTQLNDYGIIKKVSNRTDTTKNPATNETYSYARPISIKVDEDPENPGEKAIKIENFGKDYISWQTREFTKNEFKNAKVVILGFDRWVNSVDGHNENTRFAVGKRSIISNYATLDHQSAWSNSAIIGNWKDTIRYRKSGSPASDKDFHYTGVTNIAAQQWQTYEIGVAPYTDTNNNNRKTVRLGVRVKDQDAEWSTPLVTDMTSAGAEYNAFGNDPFMFMVSTTGWNRNDIATDPDNCKNTNYFDNIYVKIISSNLTPEEVYPIELDGSGYADAKEGLGLKLKSALAATGHKKLYLKNSSGGSVLWTPAWNGTYEDANGDIKPVMTVVPKEPFENGETYKLTGSIEDIYGNTYIIEDISFTALNIPGSEGVTSVVTPAVTTNVPVRQEIVVTFSHAIENTASLEFTKGGADALSEANVSWNDANTVATIRPVTIWTPGATYSIAIGENSSFFGDAVDVHLTYSFTTTTSLPDGPAYLDSISAEIDGEEYPIIYDKTNGKVYLPKAEGSSEDFTQVTLNAELVNADGSEAVDAFLKLGSTELSEDSNLSGATTSAGLKLVVDNGIGEETEYDICWYVDTKPEQTSITYGDAAGNAMTFEDLTADASDVRVSTQLQGYQFIDKANYKANAANNFIRVGTDPTNASNKVLHIGGYAKDTVDWTFFQTKEIPGSELIGAKSIVLSFDRYLSSLANNENTRFSFVQKAGEDNDSVTNHNKQWVAGVTFANWTNFIMYRKNSGNTEYKDPGLAVAEGVWQSYEIGLAPYINEAGEETVSAGVRIKNKSASWSGNLDTSAILSEDSTFKFESSKTYVWRITSTGKRTADAYAHNYYDNIKITILREEVTPVVTPTAGKTLSDTGAAAEIELKTALAADGCNITLKDKDGEAVSWTPEWSVKTVNGNLKPVLKVVPDEALENGETYTLGGMVTDIFGNVISLETKEYQVMPEGFENYDTIVFSNIDSVLALGSTSEVSLTGQNEGGTPENIAAEMYEVTSLNENVLRVTPGSDSYSVTAEAPGWAYFKTYSDSYVGVDTQKLVYVARTPLNLASDYTYSVAPTDMEVSGIDVKNVAAGTEIKKADVTPVADDKNQTYTFIYSHSAERNVEGTVKVEYTVDGTPKVYTLGVSLPKPTAEEVFKSFTVTLPEDLASTYTITFTPASSIYLAGSYFAQGINMEEVNNVTATGAKTIVESIAKSMGQTTVYTGLLQSIKDSLAADFAAVGADFADVDAVKTWMTEHLATAKTESDELKNQSSILPGGDDDDDSSSTTYPSVTPGVTGPTTPAPAVTTGFTDLGAASWARTAITYLYNEGIVSGKSDKEFAPLDYVTREEFVKLVVEAFGIYDPFLNSGFSDVESGAWYDSYVASAVQAGIVNGVSATEFGVGQNITREQMATMLMRACEKYGVKLSKTKTTYFSDSDSIANYAKHSIETLAAAGIFSGVNGAFLPKDSANRAMAAQVIYLVYIIK